jgi:hypothetical protein
MLQGPQRSIGFADLTKPLNIKP